jgi:hypothetical protein
LRPSATSRSCCSHRLLVRAQAYVAHEAPERRPVVETVGRGPRQLTARPFARGRNDQPPPELVECGLRALGPECRAFLRTHALRIRQVFEPIHAPNELQRVRDATVRVPEREELAPGMGPAADLDRRGRLVIEEPVEHVRGIRLDVALAPGQKLPRPARACSGRRVAEHHIAIVTHVAPHGTTLDVLGTARIEHLETRRVRATCSRSITRSRWRRRIAHAGARVKRDKWLRTRFSRCRTRISSPRRSQGLEAAEAGGHRSLSRSQLQDYDPGGWRTSAADLVERDFTATRPKPSCGLSTATGPVLGGVESDAGSRSFRLPSVWTRSIAKAPHTYYDPPCTRRKPAKGKCCHDQSIGYARCSPW